MLRTCAVRLLAIELTLSVKFFQVPATPSTLALLLNWAVGADLAGDSGSPRRRRHWSWSTLSCSAFPSSLQDFAVTRSTVDLRLKVAAPDRRSSTSAMLRTWAVRFEAMKLTIVGASLFQVIMAAPLNLVARTVTRSARTSARASAVPYGPATVQAAEERNGPLAKTSTGGKVVTVTGTVTEQRPTTPTVEDAEFHQRRPRRPVLSFVERWKHSVQRRHHEPDHL